MVLKRRHILSLVEGECDRYGKPKHWSYPSNPSPKSGAFRALSVRHLLRKPPTLTLYEWRSLRFPNQDDDDDDEDEDEDEDEFPRYAAISHVWKMSNAVEEIAEKENRNLYIETEDDIHKTSWLGLQEVANAADQRKCEYMWLDLACIDQVPTEPENPREFSISDKARQMNNMGSIYKYANVVIIMVGGVAAVQGVDRSTKWMERAWTLQEAVICEKRTFALVSWPPKGWPPEGWSRDDTADSRMVKLLKGRSQHALVDLNFLLDLADSHPSLVKCLGKGVKDRSHHPARTALRAAMHSDPGVRKAGVWRSIFLRTSTKPRDVSYSVMSLLRIKLDPYHKARDAAYAFNDLARKAAHAGDPAWLCIGAINGSSIPRDPESRLIPQLPQYEGHELPFYEANLPLEKLVGHLKYFISEYSIRFKTISQPHLICAYILKIEFEKLWKVRNSNLSQGTIQVEDMKGTCTYFGEKSDMAVFVGKIQSWSSQNSPRREIAYDGAYYILFLKWETSGWIVSGNGAIRLGGEIGRLPVRRHFTIGKSDARAVNSRKSWYCDCNSLGLGKITPTLSYGISGFRDTNPSLMEWERIAIKWLFYKGVPVQSKQPWKEFSAYYDSSSHTYGISEAQKKPPPAEIQTLELYVCKSANPPRYPDETTIALTKIDIEMSDLDVVSEVPAAEISRTLMGSDEDRSSGGLRVSSTCLATIEFREQVVYLKTKPKKRTPDALARVAVVPYHDDSGYY